jgi:multidrug transporter EmrE-like cation transporter
LNKYLIFLILCSVMLSSIAQIVLKMGMSNAVVLNAIQSGSSFQAIKAIATNIFVIGGLGLYFSSAAVWLLVLAKVDVSYAYPFVGLGFVVTMLLAYFVSGEPLTTIKVAGTLCIALGVAIISQG